MVAYLVALDIALELGDSLVSAYPELTKRFR